MPKASIEAELIVRKSRFVARAAFADSRDKALSFVERTRSDYADANHHCWAYVLGAPEQASGAAMSDDGEPSGTAGKPIFNVLQHRAIGDVIVVVTRYFGGIKLGAGGLVRAYSGATQKVIERLPTSQFVSRRRFRVRMDFSKEQSFRHWLSVHEGTSLKCDYLEFVRFEVELALDACNELLAAAGEHGWRVEDIADE